MSIIRSLLVTLRALCGRPDALLITAEALSARGRHAAAFPLFVRAARGGLAAAQRRIGECYLDGAGVPPNLSEAMRWLGTAAEADDTAAQTQLASLALRGACAAREGTLFAPVQTDTPDFDLAEHWSRRAAGAGSGDGAALLGLVLTAGPEGRRDLEAAKRCYQTAADAGSARGRLGLAAVLMNEGGRDAIEIAAELLRAIEGQHIPAASFLTGALAESGAAGSPDFAAAADAYRDAAEQGVPAAQFRYGLALLAGRGVMRDEFSAETWLRRAALGGETRAAAALGDMYAKEDGDLSGNAAAAASWYAQAAEAGHAGAARQLGRAYLLGSGVPKDTQLAIHWLRAAIRGGDVMAQVDMAPLSLARRSSERDQCRTAAWFRELSEAGNKAACYNLGLCLMGGIGVARDFTEARACFVRAADAVPAARARLNQLTASA